MIRTTFVAPINHRIDKAFIEGMYLNKCLGQGRITSIRGFHILEAIVLDTDLMGRISYTIDLDAEVTTPAIHDVH